MTKSALRFSDTWRFLSLTAVGFATITSSSPRIGRMSSRLTMFARTAGPVGSSPCTPAMTATRGPGRPELKTVITGSCSNSGDPGIGQNYLWIRYTELAYDGGIGGGAPLALDVLPRNSRIGIRVELGEC